MSVIDVRSRSRRPPRLRAPRRCRSVRPAPRSVRARRAVAGRLALVPPPERRLRPAPGRRDDGAREAARRHRDPAQLRALADVADKHATGKGHVTTRQNVQFHFVPTAETEDALRILADSGITTKEACGHSVRNWTCCPFAGVAADEPFDPTPYVEALARHLLRGTYSSTLPRKLKPSLGGCCGTDCSQAFINDLGFLARKARRTRSGSSSSPAVVCRRYAARDRRRRIRSVAELFEAADAIVRVFHRIGNRNNRAKARLKWAIDKIGADAFIAEYHAERATIRAEGGVPLVLPPQPAPPPRRPGLAQVTQPERGLRRVGRRFGPAAEADRILRGRRPPDPRRYHAGAVPRGRRSRRAIRRRRGSAIERAELRAALCPDLEASRAASRARSHRPREVRREPHQRRDQLPRCLELQARGHRSRGLAGVLTDLLDRRPDLVAATKGLDIKVSGCPHGCGQHYIAGIGFQGGMRKLAGKPAPQYLVYVGGGIAADRADFGRLIGKVPARRGGATLERLLDFYNAAGATSHAFWARFDGRLEAVDRRSHPARRRGCDAETSSISARAPHSRSSPAKVNARSSDLA